MLQLTSPNFLLWILTSLGVSYSMMDVQTLLNGILLKWKAQLLNKNVI